jgi:hypothetical protein
LGAAPWAMTIPVRQQLKTNTANIAGFMARPPHERCIQTSPHWFPARIITYVGTQINTFAENTFAGLAHPAVQISRKLALNQHQASPLERDRDALGQPLSALPGNHVHIRY